MSWFWRGSGNKDIPVRSNTLLRILQLIRRPITLVFCLVLVVSLLPAQLVALAVDSNPLSNISTNLNMSDLWVDGVSGNDANDGLTPGTAFRSIQKAADVASAGTIVHILPGIYRESVRPAQSGAVSNPIIYKAESGRGTVSIRGSTASSSLTWTQMTENTIGLPAGVILDQMYYADLSSWGLEAAPRFLVELNQAGEVVNQYKPAREPDIRVDTEWKVNEFWWFANGGSSIPACDPVNNSNHNCDEPTRSFTQLTDSTTDSDPVGIEPGNLTTLGDLSGATLVAMDDQHAHYTYRRTIIQHDTVAGRVTVDENCDNDGSPGLGWGSKYYVENHPALLDHPGEWWYDAASGRLYLWSPSGGNPSQMNLEISRLEDAMDLTNRSYITFDGISIAYFNGTAYRIYDNDRDFYAYGNQLKNSTIQYVEDGIVLYQFVDSTQAQLAVDGFLLENSDIGYINGAGLDSHFYWPGAPSPDQFTYAGVRNLTIRNNQFHHLGFSSEERSAVGLRFFYPDKIRFEGNYLHNIAQNGVHFQNSVIVSDKYYGFSPEEIKIGEILIKDNIFEKACQGASDCGGLKFGGGSRPDNHVFRDVLITGNIFRNNFGWSYVSILRDLNHLGDAQGFYLDNASGVHVYRNIAYNNSGAGFKLSCLWRDGDAIYINNIAANNYVYGFTFTGQDECDDHNGSVNTRLVNNIMVNNGAYAYQFNSAYTNQYGNLVIDHNLYFQNGWDEAYVPELVDVQLYREGMPVAHLHGLADIRAETPWEQHGVEGDPYFYTYDINNHEHYITTWPDFHTTLASQNVIDNGMTALPDSLTELLNRFSVIDYSFGTSYDIGRYEYGFLLIPNPRIQAMLPGGVVTFEFSLYPTDLPYLVTLSSDSPSEYLSIAFSPGAISGTDIANVTVTDSHPPGTPMNELFQSPVSGDGNGFLNTTLVGLLVGGSRAFLPVVRK